MAWSTHNEATRQGIYGGISGLMNQPQEQDKKFNAMGMLGGAGAGAKLGSMAGPWGAVLGAICGGLFGLFGG